MTRKKQSGKLQKPQGPVKAQAPRARRFLLWQMCAVAALAFACYVQTASYAFVYDDNVQIVLNPRIRTFSNFYAAFTENFWAFNAPGSYTNYYRPLQTVSYIAAYASGGLSPEVYHWLNIILHTLASIAVFWVGWELFGNATVALIAGLLFAAHPMHTESVTWIAGITDVGCGLFYFLSLAAYLRSRKAARSAIFWEGVSLTAFLAALLYKEMALTLPIAIVLLDLFPFDREIPKRARASRRMWLEMGAVLAIYLALRINALGAFSRTVIPLPISLAEKAATSVFFAGRYLQDLLFPFRQNAFHVFRPFSRVPVTELLLPAVLLGAQVYGLWALWKKQARDLWFAAVMMILTLVPVLKLGSVGANMYTERYLYIPSLGFCLLIAGAARRWIVSERTLSACCGILVTLWASLTLIRNPVWSNEQKLYAATIEVSPDAALIRNNYGKLLFEQRDLTGSRRQFEAALEANDRIFMPSTTDRSASLLGLSAVASAEGQWQEAWNLAKQASETRAATHRSDALQLMGMLLGKKGEYAEAERLLRAAVALRPGNDAAHVNLGNVLVVRQDFAGAEREYRTAMEANPRNAGALVSLALLLTRTQRNDEATMLLRRVLEIDPGNAHARQLFQQLSGGRR